MSVTTDLPAPAADPGTWDWEAAFARNWAEHEAKFPESENRTAARWGYVCAVTDIAAELRRIGQLRTAAHIMGVRTPEAAAPAAKP